jgi:hypothetical protein
MRHLQKKVNWDKGLLQRFGEHVASVFRIEEYSKQETSKKKAVHEGYRHVPPKRLLSFNELRGVIFRKAEILRLINR